MLTSKSKIIPNNIPHDKEAMYATIIMLKNELKKSVDENIKLKGFIISLENEIKKKDKLFQVLAQSGTETVLKTNQEINFITVLKNKVRKLESELADKNKEIQELKKDTNVSKLREYAIQLKLYEDECVKLQNRLAKRENASKLIIDMNIFKEGEVGIVRNIKLSLRLMLIGYKLSLEKFMNKFFKYYDNNEEISIKELSKMFDGYKSPMECKEKNYLVRYLVGAKSFTRPYYHCIVSEVKSRFMAVMNMGYSYTETDFNNSINGMIEKIKPHLEDIKQSLSESIIDMDSIKIDQWERLFDKYQLDLNEFEKDVLLYLAFRPHRNLDSLSLGSVLRKIKGENDEFDYLFDSTNLHISTMNILKKLDESTKKRNIKLDELLKNYVNKENKLFQFNDFLKALREIEIVSEDERELEEDLVIKPESNPDYVSIDNLAKAMNTIREKEIEQNNCVDENEAVTGSKVTKNKLN